MPNGKCSEHSGVCKVLDGLSKQTADQWEELKNNRKKLDSIKNWLMLLMGGVVVQLVLTIIRLYVDTK